MISVPTVRLARMEDAPRIAQMSRVHIEAGLGWSWRTDRVLGAVRDQATNVAVVEEHRRLVGFGIMHYGDVNAHLALLAVDPECRRRGLGTRLVLWLECCAETAGIGRIGVEARADNPAAIAFYRRLGYETVETLSGYYRGMLDAVRLQKRLWVTQAT